LSLSLYIFWLFSLSLSLSLSLNLKPLANALFTEQDPNAQIRAASESVAEVREALDRGYSFNNVTLILLF
jgi:hypothetical protein